MTLSLQDLFHAVGIETALRIMQDFVDENPNITGQEMLDKMRQAYDNAKQFLEGSVDHATCRNCGQPISSFTLSDSAAPAGRGPRWVHDNPDRNRGCRAASFNPQGWEDGKESYDNRLPKTANAQPTINPA